MATPNDRPAQLPPLTGLRGVAALWVVGHHAPLFVPMDRGPFEMGHAGVDIFFVLSGFIISHVHLQEFRSVSWKGYGQFLILRLARIYPVHLAVLGAFLAFAIFRAWLGVGAADNPRYSVLGFFANLLLVQAWGWTDMRTWNSVSWSISAEWLAYLAFSPLAWMLVRASVSKALAAWFGLAGAFVAFAIFAAQGGWDMNTRLGPVRVAIGFSAGMCAYRAWSAISARPIISAWLADISVVIIVVGACMHSYTLSALPAFVLVPALTANRGIAAAILRTPAMMHLGAISYSLYMIHTLVLEVAFAPFNYTRLVNIGTDARIGIMMAAVAATYAIALATYRWIEVPSRASLRRLLEGRARRGH